MKLRLFSPFGVLLLFGTQLNSQTLYTNGTLGTGPALGQTGVNISTPLANLDVRAQCGPDNIATLLVNGQNNAVSCEPGSFTGDPFLVRTLNGPLYNYVENLVVKPDGKVGVNIFKPVELFHVHDGVMRVTGANKHGGPMVLFGGSVVNDPSDAPSGQWGIEYMPGDRGLNFWRPYLAHDGAGASTVGANYVMFMSNDNRVGIHTNKPLQDLHVNGKVYIGSGTPNFTSGFKLYVEEGILTESVRVELQSNWPDYVFEDGYDLRSLDEVKDFINTNGHLPNVPSAAEMAENGIDLGEMDARLMEKIEELTLYLIDLKEQNELLTTEVGQLKAQVAESRQ